MKSKILRHADVWLPILHDMGVTVIGLFFERGCPLMVKRAMGELNLQKTNDPKKDSEPLDVMWRHDGRCYRHGRRMPQFDVILP